MTTRTTGGVSGADALATRYGVPSVRRRRLVLAGSTLLAVVFGGWLVWVIWLNADPQVTSELESYDVVDDHQVTAVLQVHLADAGVHASCSVSALAADHSVVGQQVFTPDPADGTRQQVTLRTDRRATAVESAGCTAPGQTRAR